MNKPFRCYVLQDPGVCCDKAADEWVQELTAALSEASISSKVSFNMGSLILIVDVEAPLDAISDILVDFELKVDDMWASGPASGRDLMVNIYYKDEDQIASTTVDEGLLLSAIATATGEEEREGRKIAAIVAFGNGDVVTPGYGPLVGNLEIQDIMSSVEFWDMDSALLWSPLSWGGDEAMVKVHFQCQIEDEAGGLVNVTPSEFPTGWTFPARLMPKSTDLTDPQSLRSIIATTNAPEKIRAWARMMPFAIEIACPAPTPSQDASGFSDFLIT